MIGSEVESNYWQGSSEERGDDLEVTLASAIEHVGLSSQRFSQGVKPEETLAFDLEELGKELETELVVSSQPSGGILKENPSSSLKEFDMIRLRYMYQIPNSMELRAPLSH